MGRTLHDNPVARAELNYQRRTAGQRKWRRFPAIFLLMLAVALLTSASLLVTPQVAELLGMPQEELHELLRGWFGTVMILLGALIMFQHLTFALTGMHLAAGAIAREKQARTWESLLLTNVDGRQIVLGKWGATMRTLWQGYRSLLVLRFAVALWMGVANHVAQISPFFETAPLPLVILLGAIVAIFPLIYAGFTTTIGLIASLIAGSALTAQRIASVMHFATIALSLGSVLGLLAIPYGSFNLELASLLPALFVTPIDGGMLALVGMIAGGGSPTLAYLIGLVLCMMVYALLTGLLLRIAQGLAVRLRALPPI